MRLELARLLSAHQICHPATVTSAVISNGSLTLTVSGVAWWLATHPVRDGVINLIFAGIKDGTLQLEDFLSDHDEALDVFEIRATAGVAWLLPATSSIYGNSPLGDPFALYLKLQDFLIRESAFHTPETYLNTASTGHLSRFVEISNSRSYLLAQGPKVIRDLICTELEHQGVHHNVLTRESSPQETDPRLLVTIGSSQFVCTSAEAEYSED